MTDKASQELNLKKGLDGFFNPDIVSSLIKFGASVITGARGDKLKDKGLSLSDMPKAGDYFKDKKSVAEEFADLQDTIDAPSGFVQKSKRPSQMQLQPMRFSINSKLANRVNQILVKETFQDPNVGRYLKGVGLSIPLSGTATKIGSPDPSKSLLG